MSLINKVLRDLEARERDEQASQSRPVLTDLRAAPESPERSGVPRATWLLLAVAIVAIAVLVAWVVGRGPARAPAARVVHASVAPPKGVRVAPVAVAPPKTKASPAGARARSVVKPVPSRAFVSAAHPPIAPHRVTRRTRAGSAAISRHRKPLTAVEQAQSAYRRAVQALQAGDTAQARAALRAALRARPTSLRAALLLATLDIQGAHLRGARHILRTTLHAHPHALPAVMLLAQVDLRRGRPADAARTLGRAQPLGAASHSYWALLAASRLRAGDQAGALSAYRSGLKRFPGDGSLWVGEGIVESRRGHTRRARLAWRQASHCPLTPVLARFVQAELQGGGAAQKR